MSNPPTVISFVYLTKLSTYSITATYVMHVYTRNQFNQLIFVILLVNFTTSETLLVYDGEVDFNLLHLILSLNK